MYCMYCGKEITEGVACPECLAERENELDNAKESVNELDNAKESVNDIYSQPAFSQPAFSQPAFSQPASKSDKDIYGSAASYSASAADNEGEVATSKFRAVAAGFGSPVALIFCILLTADFIIGYLTLSSFGGIISLINIIGVWLICTGCRKYIKTNGVEPARTAGFTMLSITSMINLVLSAIAVFAIVIMCVLVLVFQSEVQGLIDSALEYLSKTIEFTAGFAITPVILVVLLIPFICMGVLAIVYYAKINSTMKFSKASANNMHSRGTVSIFPAIALVAGALLLLSAVAYQIVLYDTYVQAINKLLDFANEYVNDLGYNINLNPDIFGKTQIINYAIRSITAVTYIFGAITLFRTRSLVKNANR